MLKRILSMFALMAMATLNMSADYAIIINRNNGDFEAFMLSEKPVLTFDDTDMLVNYDGSVVSIPKNDISFIYFDEEYSGLSKPETILDRIEMLDGNSLRISAVGGAKVNVYDMSGRTPGDISVTTDGTSTIVSVAKCASGAYVITYNNKSLKIIKK